MKDNFDKIIHGGHHSSTDTTPQNHWKDGRGRRILSAVKDEEGFDTTDDLPKHGGRTKQYGWESRTPSLNWRAMYRWFRAQVGRSMDDVRSEVAASLGKDNYASRRMREMANSSARFENLTMRLRVEIRDNPPYGPALFFVTPDGSHIHGPAHADDLYVDEKGILQAVPRKLVDQVNTLKKKSMEGTSEKAKWVKNIPYFKLKGVWLELTLERLSYDEYPQNSPRPWRCTTPRKGPCILCQKLGKYWSYSYMDLFGDRYICVKMRTLGKREINRLLLNAGE